MLDRILTLAGGLTHLAQNMTITMNHSREMRWGHPEIPPGVPPEMPPEEVLLGIPPTGPPEETPEPPEVPPGFPEEEPPSPAET